MLVPFVHMLSTFFCTSSPHEGGRHHKSVSNSYNGSRLHRAAWKQGCQLHTLLLSYCTGKVEKGYVIAALVEASRSLVDLEVTQHSFSHPRFCWVIFSFSRQWKHIGSFSTGLLVGGKHKTSDPGVSGLVWNTQQCRWAPVRTHRHHLSPIGDWWHFAFSHDNLCVKPSFQNKRSSS